MTPSAAGPLHTLFAPSRFLDNHVFQTKAGELGVLVQPDGIDYECLTDATLEDQHTRLLAAERPFDEDFRTYQYLVKLERPALATSAEHSNPVVAATVRNRREFLETKPEKLYSIRLYRAILYKPGKWRKPSAEQIEQSRRLLLTRARSLLTSAGDLLGLKLLDKPEIFRFFRLLASVSPELAGAERLCYDDNLDYWMGSVPIGWQDDALCVDRTRSEVLSLRKLPKATSPNVLRDLLSIRANFILCVEFHRNSQEQAVSAIGAAQSWFALTKWIKNIPAAIQLAFNRGKVDEWMVADKSAEADVDDLSDTLTRVNNQGDALGRFAFTAVLFDKDPGTLETAVTETIKTIGNHEGSLVRETYWALGAYSSIVPGTAPNHDFRQREMWLPVSQYVDLSLNYAHREGNRINPHLKKEHLLVLETTDQTPYYFNLHEGDLSDGLVIGQKGSGKSVLANLWADHLMKYDPFILILDGIGGSFRMLLQKHSGAYYELGPNGDWPFTVNPMHLEDSANTRQHLAMLIRKCCIIGGFTADAEKNQIIYEEVCRVMALPREERRFSALEFPREIALYLSPWVGKGQYSRVFDNAEDTFRPQRLQAIDFSAINRYKDVLQPLLLHFLYLWDEVVNDPALLRYPKLLMFDEGWKLLAVDELREHLEKEARTGRKLNAAALFFSQSIVELDRLGMLDLASELFQQKYLLAQPGADYEYYAKKLGMNEKEVEEFKSLRGKGDVLRLSPRGSKRLKINLAPSEFWLYAKSPEEDAARDAAIAEHGFDEGLKVLAAGGG